MVLPRWAGPYRSPLSDRNAEEFLRYGRSMILGKGRNGQVLRAIPIEDGERAIYQVPRPADRDGHAEGWEGPGDATPQIDRPREEARARAVRYDELFEPPITELSARCEFHFRCHDLRATFGNRLHRRGFPIETIVHLMRHETPDVTFKRCIGVDQDRMRSAMDRLCPSRPIQ